MTKTEKAAARTPPRHVEMGSVNRRRSAAPAATDVAPSPWRSRIIVFLTALAALLAGSAALGVAPAAASAPFHGTALWVSQVPAQTTPQALGQDAVSDGVSGLYIKAGDGSTPNPQFTSMLVHGLKAGGVSVCAWTFIYGADPRAEAAVAIAAVHDGAQCLVVDAEGQYDGRYASAQLFVQEVRAHVGTHFPIGLAGQAEVLKHPTFPYSVFLGPGGFNFDLPQIYWKDLGVSVDQAFLASIGANAIYGRPIVPVGQLYGAPSTAAVARFRSLAAAYGCNGLSFFSLDAAQKASLLVLGGPAPPLSKHRAVPPTIRPGADGDQIVWAQELLNAAGARLPVGGFYGQQTSMAVANFQTRHRLLRNGILNPATWALLMRLHAKEPPWTKLPPPDSARTQKAN
jgi:hypothetical protein